MSFEDFFAKKIKITGTIQGVGFRPFVYRLAQVNKLSGNIKNSGTHVDIYVQGSRVNIENFLSSIQQKTPPLARFDSFLTENTAINTEVRDFTIAESSQDYDMSAHNIKDYALCDRCFSEFCDPKDRRYQYGFISCTDCGPRYSILRKFPFDRENTSFSSFTVCDECEQEYKDPENHRFHAQNISCKKCGPKLSLSYDNDGLNDSVAVIETCRKLLLTGKILCVKGVSGYRLFCDAENKKTIEKLRRLKGRPEKPFAVMYPDKNDFQLLKSHLNVSQVDYTSLTQIERPIVLIEKNEIDILASNIAPGLSSIGVMLPASGLEYLLLNAVNRPLIATSANLPGGNIIINGNIAESKLFELCDGFLHHNLAIQQGLDDSLFKNNFPIRLGRGYAPYEQKLPFKLKEPILALGAQAKNTITLAWDNKAVTSQHLGDMNNFEAWQKTISQIEYFQDSYNIKIKRYLVDSHPDYTSHQWVKDNSQPYTEILHHHAHASALAFEHSQSLPMLVFTWDGTGYGENGMLWGGEAFYGCSGDWTHVFTTRLFKMPGGEQAIKEPWRIAASLCWHANQEYRTDRLEVENLRNLRNLWNSTNHCPVTSSIGRLFDAAAVFLGLGNAISYDGQAAMKLESIAVHETTDFIELTLKKAENFPIEFDWEPLLGLLQDESLLVSYKAKVFHNTLANMILQKAQFLSNERSFEYVGLTGGVFQNSLLRKTATKLLENHGFTVLLNDKIPSNDAAISLGQIMEYGMKQIQ